MTTCICPNNALAVGQHYNFCPDYASPSQLPSNESTTAMDNVYDLFHVSVWNPTDGTIFVDNHAVTARSHDAARNQGVGLLAENLPEGKTLAEMLDVVTIKAHSF